jgi:hypothetical protein
VHVGRLDEGLEANQAQPRKLHAAFHESSAREQGPALALHIIATHPVPLRRENESASDSRQLGWCVFQSLIGGGRVRRTHAAPVAGAAER